MIARQPIRRGPACSSGGIAAGVSSISAVNLILIAIVGLSLSAVFHVDVNQGPVFYICYSIAAAVAVSVCFVPLRLIVVPIAIIVLLMPDLTQSSLEIEAFGRAISASLWQLPFGPVSPAILVMICLAVALLRISMKSTIRTFSLTFSYFFIVSVLTSLYFGYAQESWSRFISDFKILVFLYMSLLLFDAYFRLFPLEILRVTQLFLMFLIGSLLYQALANAVSVPPVELESGYVHGSLDSAKGLLLVITFFSIAKIGQGKSIATWVLIACLSLYFLISYQTRWLIVTFMLGLLVVYFVYPLKKKFLLLLMLIPAISLAIVTLVMFESEALRIMVLRFGFIQDIGLDSSIIDVEITRAGSIINSVNQLLERNALLTGAGYGSWYSDEFFPMQNLNISAFDEESLQSGRFYRVHDFIFHFLFKFGIIGLTVYLWLFIKPLRQLWTRKREIMRQEGGANLLVVIFGITPTVITYMWFTGKGNIFCGFFIALCIAWLTKLVSDDRVRDAAQVSS